MKRLFHIVILLTFYTVSEGQITDPEKFVQVSGIITDMSENPVEGVTIISRKLRINSKSEKSGIYAITSTPGDTIYFRALGFKRYHTIIPLSYQAKNCMVDIELEQDTIQIAEITILPWKSYDEFIKDITKEQPVDPQIQNMNDNMASIYVAIANQTGVDVLPEESYRNVMSQHFDALATRNQYPINNLLNPFKWSQFINEIKKGLFKSKKIEKPVEPRVIKKRKKKNYK